MMENMENMFAWRCNNCTTRFMSAQRDRPEGDNTGPACPHCKAYGQYTYRDTSHFGDPCRYCGTPHDDVQPGPCRPSPARDEGAGTVEPTHRETLLAEALGGVLVKAGVLGAEHPGFTGPELLLAAEMFLAAPVSAPGVDREEGIRGPHEPAAPGLNGPSADALRPGKWRKRPVVIDAFRLGHDPMPDWFCDKVTTNEITTHNVDGRWRGGPDYALINGLEGQLRAEFGDWIIRGVRGEAYSCKPHIFAETYEPADGSQVEPSTTGAGRHIPLEPNPFIQWNGGENPAPGKVVEVRYKLSTIVSGAAPSSQLCWEHAPENSPVRVYDIIAYRIIPTDDSDTGKVSG